MTSLRANPSYKLSVGYQIGTSSSTNTFYFKTLHEIKAFLANSLTNVTRCRLYKTSFERFSSL